MKKIYIKGNEIPLKEDAVSIVNVTESTYSDYTVQVNPLVVVYYDETSGDDYVDDGTTDDNYTEEPVEEVM